MRNLRISWLLICAILLVGTACSTDDNKLPEDPLFVIHKPIQTSPTPSSPTQFVFTRPTMPPVPTTVLAVIQERQTHALAKKSQKQADDPFHDTSVESVQFTSPAAN